MYKLEICNHPAQARHPLNKKPLFKDDKPVPLFPKERCIKLDGTIIAYVNEHRKVMFLFPPSKLGTIQDEAIKLVRDQLGDPEKVVPMTEPPVELEEFVEDEEDQNDE